MTFGKESKYPSTTRGMIKLMKDYETSFGTKGKELPISIEGDSRAFLCIRLEPLASIVSSHGPEIEL